jgi:hypothetical protein
MFYDNPYYLGKRTAVGTNLKGRMVRKTGRAKKRLTGAALSAWRKAHLKGLHYKVKVKTYRKRTATRANPRPLSLYDNPLSKHRKSTKRSRAAKRRARDSMGHFLNPMSYDNPRKRKSAKRGKRKAVKSKSVSARLSRLEHSVKAIKKSQKSLVTRLERVMGVRSLPSGL